MAETLSDVEFGEINVRRSQLARYVRVKIGPSGELSASLPLKAPLRLVKQLIEQSRDELRRVIGQQDKTLVLYQDGQRIGKSHILHIENQAIDKPRYRLSQQVANVYLPLKYLPEDKFSQTIITQVVKRALSKQAKAFLPRRVKYLADAHEFTIETVRFNNARTRWGSCSSKKSINLNIALMQLPDELIDYVIIHELCHTRHMNHSISFWELVERYCPDYKNMRKMLKTYHSYL